MISETAKRQLREMKLDDAIDLVEGQGRIDEFQCMPFEERLEFLVQALYEAKQQERIKGLRRRARLKFPNANINGIYYQDRGLDRNKILNLSSGNFLEQHNCILFKGPTGSGKSYLACAMAYNTAILKGMRTLYVRLPDMIQTVCAKNSDKRKLLRKYSTPSVLIIDEWLTNDLTKEGMEFLLDLMDARSDGMSTFFCSLYPSGEWSDRLGSCVLGESVLDRIVHGMETVFCGNLNMRELQKSGMLRDYQ